MTGLVSGEGVAIELRRAGLGSRIVAAAIDLGVQLAALLVVAIIDGLIDPGDADVVGALLIVELVLILAGYPILSEWLTKGHTIGKLALGLRVVRDDGGPVGFRQSLTRGLAGLILEKPGIAFPPLCTAIGMITLGASKSSKRIGDMMAGTFVVNERAGPRSALERVPLFVPPALYGWAQSLDLAGVDDDLALQLRQFVVRAGELAPGARQMIEAQLHARVLAVISPPPPAGAPAAVTLMTVLAERRRRAELTAAGGYGPRPAPLPYQPAPYQAPAPYQPVPYQPAPTQTGTPTAPPNVFTPPS